MKLFSRLNDLERAGRRAFIAKIEEVEKVERLKFRANGCVLYHDSLG